MREIRTEPCPPTWPTLPPATAWETQPRQDRTHHYRMGTRGHTQGGGGVEDSEQGGFASAAGPGGADKAAYGQETTVQTTH